MRWVEFYCDSKSKSFGFEYLTLRICVSPCRLSNRFSIFCGSLRQNLICIQNFFNQFPLFIKDPTHTALLRLAWNKQDPNYLATVAMDSCEVIILDVRVPCTPVARLSNHRACVNGIAWAPHR